MTIYLYAYLTTPKMGVTDVALVGEYSTRHDTQAKLDIEKMCYSDEGVRYWVMREPVTPPPNVTYEELLLMVEK